MAQKAIRARFDTVDRDRTGSLDFAEFELFYENLVRNDALTPVFERFAHGSRYIDRHGLAEFARECQGVELSRAQA
jgi:hypothetical protein